METLIEQLEKRADSESSRIFAAISSIIDAVAKEENAGGNASYVLRPNAPVETKALKVVLIPVILTKNIDQCAERADRALLGMIGVKRTKIVGAPMFSYGYMFDPIFHIALLGDYRLDVMSDRMLSRKYYLPLLYRFIEETGSEAAFALEEKWKVHDDVPLSLLTTKKDDDRWMKVKRGLLSIVGHDAVPFERQVQESIPSSIEEASAFYDHLNASETGSKEADGSTADSGASSGDETPVFVTGVTAALLDLGIEVDHIPFPIELTTTDLARVTDKILAIVPKADVRHFQINHPSGQRYISVIQFLVDGREAVTLYDLIRFVGYSVSEKGSLSPFVIMAQLCYSAWLIERRGSDRAKWVYSLLRIYRSKMDQFADRKYKTVRPAINWFKYYFFRSPIIQR